MRIADDVVVVYIRGLDEEQIRIHLDTWTMDADEFRKHGKEMVDFIADYWDTLHERKPMPDVKPGFMDDLVSILMVYVD